MGMFDRVHTLERCGQVKCWGQNLTDWTIGCRPRLYVSVDEGGARGALDLRRQVDHSPDQPEEDNGSARGWRLSDLTSYQILMTEGFLIIRNGEWVDWSDDRAEDLPVVDNGGRDIANTGHRVRPGWTTPGSECEVCSPVDFGDLDESELPDWLRNKIWGESTTDDPKPDGSPSDD